MSAGDRLCRVVDGKLYREDPHGTVTKGRGDIALKLITDAPEDAGFREAWERRNIVETRPLAVANRRKNLGLEPERLPLPDGYYVARGPGIVACEADHDHVMWAMAPGCPKCNPDKLSHPTLVPLSEPRRDLQARL